MECHFIGIYKNGILCACALAQYLDLSAIATFKADKPVGIREYLLKKFTSHLLIIGNNMLTGQNAYVHNKNISDQELLITLHKAILLLVKLYRSRKIKIRLLGVKDFNNNEMPDFKAAVYKGYYTFTTQPNMVMHIRNNWETAGDYLSDMNTKYRTQYNRARKKAEGIEKRKLNADEIKFHESEIHNLYLTVASNAAFNTFYLPKGHFETFKRYLNDDFLFYGYFLENRLVGFSTLIKNNRDIDTYFLGYDAGVQKEIMLYLNMLYDMAGYAIKKQFLQVIFARSAMEIKSSIGAVPEEVFGLIKHTNPILNYFMKRFFTYFDPKIEWKQRSPFKD